MKRVFLLLVLFVLTAGCSQTEQQEVKSVVIDILESQAVQAIRAMEMDNGVNLGDLFEAGLSSPTYELFDPAEDGNTYVNIQGNANLNGQTIVITVQYIQVEDESYKFHVVAFNDIPQNMIQASGFFEYLFDEYDKIQIEKTVSSETSVSEKEAEIKETTETTQIEESGEALLEGNGLNYLNYTLQDIEDEFGTAYEVIDYEGGKFLRFLDESIPYSFGFVNLDPTSQVVTIYLSEGTSYKDVIIGMSADEIIGILGMPESMGEDEMGENGFEIYYSFEDHSITFSAMDQNSPTTYAILRNH